MAPEWHRLPDLVLLKVLGFLDRRDRVAVSETCVAWGTALNYPSIWRRVEILLDRDLLLCPGDEFAPKEPLAMHLARLFATHMRRLEMVWSRPVNSSYQVYPKVSRGAHAEAGVMFLALLSDRAVQLRELVLTDWVFSYKWGNRNKLLNALTNFLGTQRELEVLRLKNACMSMGETLRLVTAVVNSTEGNLKHLDLRSSFREWHTPHTCASYLETLGRLTGLTRLELDYSALSDGALSVLAETGQGRLSCLHIAIHDTDNRNHVLSDEAWRQLITTCPNIRVHISIVNIAHHEDLSYFLLPSIPLHSFHLFSGSVWDQSRSRNFRGTLQLLLKQYTNTLGEYSSVDLDLNLKNNREMVDDLILELIYKSSHLLNLKYDGVLRNINTLREICHLQLNDTTRKTTLDTLNQDSIPDLPVIGSPDYYESDALYHVTSERVQIN
uniref:F-box domain-containing protein n=1 Tax=Timema bartmani TaxID=61472 RepID=A0A7R9EQL0_9NEOP|nr:unnamed protein product [Timema bartmani]